MDIMAFYERIAGENTVPATILSMSVMLLAGFLVTRITKKLHLPNVTAYIVAGILIGPFCLNLIPSRFVEATGFLPDIALAFIAFGTGEFFRLDTIRKNGIKVFLITIFEALGATLLVFGLCYGVFGLSMPFSMVLSALAAATAPASTMMTIRQTGASGEFVDTLLQVVALDDMVGLIAYSVAISLATSAIAGGAASLYGSFLPFLLNIAVVILGGIFGYFIYLFMRNRHTTDNRLIIAIALMLTFCGVSAVLEVSPLLGCMAMGAVYINLSDDDRLFKQLNYFNPPILLLFFVRSGISFDLGSLFKAGSYGAYPLILVGVGYFLIRIAGKYFGSMLGCRIAGSGRPVRKYLGLALIPQAGVAIGLAELGARTLKGEMGNALLTIILSSSVLYELIGPAAAKFALYKSGSYVPEEDTVADGDE
ncbi:MAG: cation:proton antiporter, partial [Lachnospiraceae bacterium]|nr:cation:proton antiporter [Lachnospiraceae bacterium]